MLYIAFVLNSGMCQNGQNLAKREYTTKKRVRIKNGIGDSGVEKGNKKIPARSAGILCRARLIISKSLC